MLTDGELEGIAGRLAAPRMNLSMNQEYANPGTNAWTRQASTDMRALLDDVRALRGLLAEARDSVPQVWDGAHLADCPYIDVLRGIRSRIDAALQGQAG